MMKVATIWVILIATLLSGCGLSKRLGTFETVIMNPRGEKYSVCTKHGARAIFRETEGDHDVQFEVDDRGLPESPGWFSNLMTLAGAKLISQE